MPDFKNSNFKNLEWLQYIISRKIDELYKQKKQEESSKLWETTIPIFSLIGTLSITILTTTKDLTWKDKIFYAAMPFIFLLICWCVKKFVDSNYAKNIKIFFEKNKIYSLSTDEVECKSRIKEFDNVVCTNILLTYAFIAKYNEDKNINVKIYYCHEIQFYLMEAIDKIYIMSDEKFINKVFLKNENEEQKIKKIKIDRMYNVLDMIEENLKFLDETYKEIKDLNKLKTIKKELDNMIIDFDEIKSRFGYGRGK